MKITGIPVSRVASVSFMSRLFYFPGGSPVAFLAAVRYLFFCVGRRIPHPNFPVFTSIHLMYVRKLWTHAQSLLGSPKNLH